MGIKLDLHNFPLISNKLSSVLDVEGALSLGFAIILIGPWWKCNLYLISLINLTRVYHL